MIVNLQSNKMLVLVLIIILPLPIPFIGADASSRTPYQSGYNHGCDDADLSPSDRYINEPGKGPSYHTEEFMSGYYNGFRACGGGGGAYQPYYPPAPGVGINWENLCLQYYGLLGLKEPCREYADGPYLTQKGRTALVCYLGGAVTLLSGLDPGTKASIIQAGRSYCP
jgi:hypothetical protein